MVLSRVFSPKAINIQLESDDKDEVFEELIEVLAQDNPNFDRQSVLAAIQDRESKMSTGIMPAIAVPHGKTDAVTGVQGVVGISHKGIDYQSLDSQPVHLIILLLSASNSCEFHLRVLRRLARILAIPSFYSEVMIQKSAQDVYDLICSYEEKLN